jgi:hypothetical protein
MKKYFFLINILIPFFVFSQDYSVAFIPDSLMKNANAVLRVEQTNIIIHSINSATVINKYAYTILNEKGDHFADYRNFYDDFDKLTDVSGKLYDANGKKIKSVRKKEMEDVAYDDHFSLIVDARIKRHNFYCKQYPYTIEYEQEEEYKGIHNFQSWDPVPATNLSVQKNILRIDMPADYKLRFKLLNGAKEPVVHTEDKKKILQWELNNFTAFDPEPLQPSITSITPNVLIGPSDFEYGGYKGNMDTWKNYGDYYVTLCKGRDVLPGNIKDQIHRMVDGISDREQKINLLYEYLQKNTHYISVQLGIGGLQPFEASYVAEKKYGDCKALSNYMVSLLKEAGIKAYAAIIFGGTKFKEFYEDFPKDYFNHVVACVPNGKDSIWLECTSQTNSAGYSGSFTGNRKALLITDDGGEIVNTPSYTSADNLQIRKVNATIDVSGTLTATVNTHFTGLQQDFPNELMNEATAEQRQEFLNNELNLPTYKVEKMEYKESKGKLPSIDEYLKITAENYANVTGKRLFIAPNLFNKVRKLTSVDDRKFPVDLSDAYRDSDSIYIKIPEGYIVESMPPDKIIENKFGSYKLSCSFNNDTIKIVRNREQNKATFRASDYASIVSFFDSMYKSDRGTIVFIKKER